VSDNYIVKSAGQLFNTPTKKVAIVFLAVAVIVALGVYLLGAGDCLRRFRAATPTPPPSPDPSVSTASLSSPSIVTAAPDATHLLNVPPRNVFEQGERRGITHYKRSDSLAGWIFIRASVEGSIEARMFLPYDPTFLTNQINEEALSNEVPNLDGCISAQEVETSLAEQARVEEASPFLMPDTRASKVPANVVQEGERLGATHYLHRNVRSSFFDDANEPICSGWIIINDRLLTSCFIPSGEDEIANVCPYPTDTTGSITAEEVRACRPTGSFMDPDNQTNFPPEFVLVFGEERGATGYTYQPPFNCWEVFCGKKTYSFKRDGWFVAFPGRENPPQATDWDRWDQPYFFTPEQVRAHYEQHRPRQPENRSSIASSASNGSSGMLISSTGRDVPEIIAEFGERCGATHYEWTSEDEWVIYFGESQSYVYAQDTFTLRPGLSQEVLNEKLENDFTRVFNPEQVKNDSSHVRSLRLQEEQIIAERDRDSRERFSNLFTRS
jgi:hypothetical protein